MRNLFLLLLLSPSLSVFSFEFSAMSFNTQNLFDTLDDPKRMIKLICQLNLKNQRNT